MRVAIRNFICARVPFIFEKLLTTRVLLLGVAGLYAIAYFFHPARPGKNSKFPTGWWGWFDQGQYLLASNATAHGDFSAGKYFYPPLYPALGAAFVRVSEMHPFWFVDLVCFLWFFYVFYYFACQYVSKHVAVGLFAVSVFASVQILQNFLIPWTTTLSMALVSTAIYGLVRFREMEAIAAAGKLSWRIYFVVGLAVGLLMATRPVDVLVGAVLALALISRVWKIENSKLLPALAVMAAAGIVGPILFLGFNFFIYGSVFGSYLGVASSNGYFPGDFVEKFVSLVLDGYSLYLEPKSGLVQHYPWLLLTFAGVAYILVRGDWMLRAVAIACCVQFALYFPYGDLLPNGLWRYLNIHYFKWTFPYFALFAWLIVARVVERWKRSKILGLQAAGAILLFVLFILSIQFSIDSYETRAIWSDARDSGGAIIQVSTRENEVDFIDFKGLEGSFTDVYFGEHRLWADGVELRKVRDFRVLPAPWGVRLLFIRPQSVKSLQFQVDSHLSVPTPPISAEVGSYKIILGIPKFTRA